MNEDLFLCGIDLGREYISIAYWNYSLNTPEIIDVSGGYGFAALSSCVVYVPDYDEWLCGEYALKETAETAVFFRSVIENTGKGIYYDVGGKRITNAQLLEKIVFEITEQIKSVDPKCEFEKITLTTGSGFSENSKKEYLYAFEKNGITFDRIIFETQLRCALRSYGGEGDAVCLLDMGSRELRAFYGKDKYKAKTYTNISATQIYNAVYRKFVGYLAEEKDTVNETEKRSFEVFFDEHKNIALKDSGGKDVNLYFSFCYPPFKKKIPSADIEDIRFSSCDKLCDIVGEIGAGHKYILAGGVFEQSDLKNLFAKRSGIDILNKDHKAVFALGAVYFSAEDAGVIPKSEAVGEECAFNCDIGIMAEDFVPIIEADNLVYGKFYSKTLIFPNSKGDYAIDVYMREKGKPPEIFATFSGKSFKQRKKGAVKLKFSIMLTENGSLLAEAEDMGFGEIYPKTDFIQKYERDDIF